MKKEEKEHKEKDRNQEERFSSEDSDEYGFEYDFFITDNSKVVEKSPTKFQPITPKKAEYATDQSKTFFLPDFFSHED